METSAIARTQEPQLLAVFEFDGTTVTATYHDAAYKRSVADGVWMTGGQKLTLGDGERFWNGLERAYANSSRISVSTVTNDRSR